MAKFEFPEFDDLPKVEGQPQGCLWGFFDNGQRKEQLGTINLLTPEVVAQAKDEIQTGRHVSLDWELHNTEFPGFGRIPLQHEVKDLKEHGFVAFDDVVSINTQTGSQWDGLKHFGCQTNGMYYNGHTHEELAATTELGLHNISDRGGIVGRGVMVDWLRWWEHKNPGKEPPSAISSHQVPVSEIEEALKWQGTTTRQGDIFIMRTGMVRWHNNADEATRKFGSREQHNLIGIANTQETVRWLYSKHFSAVAGDSQGFEAWPFPKDCVLHEWLLGQWGTPIGELWDLEALSEECVRQKRWTFFFTSAPLRVKGGVASPPNAIAIF